MRGYDKSLRDRHENHRQMGVGGQRRDDSESDEVGPPVRPQAAKKQVSGEQRAEQENGVAACILGEPDVVVGDCEKSGRRIGLESVCDADTENINEGYGEQTE